MTLHTIPSKYSLLITHYLGQYLSCCIRAEHRVRHKWASCCLKALDHQLCVLFILLLLIVPLWIKFQTVEDNQQQQQQSWKSVIFDSAAYLLYLACEKTAGRNVRSCKNILKWKQRCIHVLNLQPWSSQDLIPGGVLTLTMLTLRETAWHKIVQFFWQVWRKQKRSACH